MQSHGMEMTFFCVRDQSLHILEGTGDLGLAVSLHDRYIDQEINILYTVADPEFQAATVFCKTLVFLGVVEFHVIVIADLLITAYFKYIRSTVPHPGSLKDHHPAKTVFLEVFKDSSDDLCMRRCTIGRVRCRNHVRLDTNHLVLITDQLRKIALLQKFFGDFLVFRASFYENLVFVHEWPSCLCSSVYFSFYRITHFGEMCQLIILRGGVVFLLCCCSYFLISSSSILI